MLAHHCDGCCFLNNEGRQLVEAFRPLVVLGGLLFQMIWLFEDCHQNKRIPICHHSGELPSSLDSSSSAGGLSMGEESSFLEDLQAPADSSLSRIDDFAAQVMVPHSRNNVRGSSSSSTGGGYSSSDLSMLTASSQNSLTLRDISMSSAGQRNASWTTGASGDLPQQISNSIPYEINVEESSPSDDRDFDGWNPHGIDPHEAFLAQVSGWVDIVLYYLICYTSGR